MEIAERVSSFRLSRFQHLTHSYERYDVALPSATQNELDASDAEAAISKGCRFVAEGSNMGVDAGGIEVFEKSRIAKGSKGCWYGPGKA